jgi:hypothetical protein
LIGAAVAQAAVVGLFVWSDLGFLWFNVIGCGLVVAVSLVVQVGLRQPRQPGRPMEVST